MTRTYQPGDRVLIDAEVDDLLSCGRIKIRVISDNNTGCGNAVVLPCRLRPHNPDREAAERVVIDAAREWATDGARVIPAHKTLAISRAVAALDAMDTPPMPEEPPPLAVVIVGVARTACQRVQGSSPGDPSWTGGIGGLRTWAELVTQARQHGQDQPQVVYTP